MTPNGVPIISTVVDLNRNVTSPLVGPLRAPWESQVEVAEVPDRPFPGNIWQRQQTPHRFAVMTIATTPQLAQNPRKTSALRLGKLARSVIAPIEVPGAVLAIYLSK